MKFGEVIERLEELSDSEWKKGMEKSGINTENSIGISITNLRELAKEVGTDHELAEKLWSSGIHEARIMASMVDNPGKVDMIQMDKWAHDFNSWDLCDQVCNNLFRKAEDVNQVIGKWILSRKEFVRRGGFRTYLGSCCPL